MRIARLGIAITLGILAGSFGMSGSKRPLSDVERPSRSDRPLADDYPATMAANSAKRPIRSHVTRPNARHSVARSTPSSVASDCLSSNGSAASRARTPSMTVGDSLDFRPPFRPRALATASPAGVRSEISSRSNSARAAKMPNTSLPEAVPVSESTNEPFSYKYIVAPLRIPTK